MKNVEIILMNFLESPLPTVFVTLFIVWVMFRYFTANKKREKLFIQLFGLGADEFMKELKKKKKLAGD